MPAECCQPSPAPEAAASAEGISAVTLE